MFPIWRDSGDKTRARTGRGDADKLHRGLETAAPSRSYTRGSADRHLFGLPNMFRAFNLCCPQFALTSMPENGLILAMAVACVILNMFPRTLTRMLSYPPLISESPDGSMYWLGGRAGEIKKVGSTSSQQHFSANPAPQEVHDVHAIHGGSSQRNATLFQLHRTICIWSSPQVDADDMDSISTVLDLSGPEFFLEYEEVRNKQARFCRAAQDKHSIKQHLRLGDGTVTRHVSLDGHRR